MKYTKPKSRAERPVGGAIIRARPGWPAFLRACALSTVLRGHTRNDAAQPRMARTGCPAPDGNFKFSILNFQFLLALGDGEDAAGQVGVVGQTAEAVGTHAYGKHGHRGAGVLAGGEAEAGFAV